jgi:hypothetical protein
VLANREFHIAVTAPVGVPLMEMFEPTDEHAISSDLLSSDGKIQSGFGCSPDLEGQYRSDIGGPAT